MKYREVIDDLDDRLDTLERKFQDHANKFDNLAKAIEETGLVVEGRNARMSLSCFIAKTSVIELYRKLDLLLDYLGLKVEHVAAHERLVKND